MMAHNVLRLARRSLLRNQPVTFQLLPAHNACRNFSTVRPSLLPTAISLLPTLGRLANKYSTEQRDPPRRWDEISSAQFLSGIRNKELFLFDIRTPEEAKEKGMIPGATNIPLSELAEAFRLSPDEFNSKYHVDMPGKFEQNFIIHCCSGARSSVALKELHSAGFVLARHYPGGWKMYNQLKDTEDIDSLRPWTDVTFEELMSRIKSKDVQLFDVRTTKEVARTGMMPGATNIPMAEVGEAFRLNASDFQEEFGVRMPSKSDPNVIIHCLGGIRSLKTLSILWEAGYDHVRHYPGGWEEYIARTVTS